MHPVRPRFLSALSLLLTTTLLLNACLPLPASPEADAPAGDPADAAIPAVQADAAQVAPTPYATRPAYSPGELVDYTAQSGDTLPVLALRFNTTVDEILTANPIIPRTASTMPPGMPMKIPIYYQPFWGSSYKILPDSQFINGPAQVGFNTSQFVAEHPGWLNGYYEYAGDANRSGAEIVDYVARNFSVSPRLLLALLEYFSGALTQPSVSDEARTYAMGYATRTRPGVYQQLLWAANALNDSYYSIRSGLRVSLELQDGRMEQYDPWLNTASATLHEYFNRLMDETAYSIAVSPEGFASTYTGLFGDPWQNEQAHIPGSLEQPAFRMPFTSGADWALTGGPHTAWGTAQPYAAIDFAPPSVASGCIPTSEWATAVADGVVARTETGEVVLDLDGDGDERTGWAVFYLHIGTEGRARLGAELKAGDPVGHPSCEGGTSTGTHVHIARKYNGEWMNAGGTLAFNLEGWVAHNGAAAYEGYLVRGSSTVTACVCSNRASFIHSERP